MSSFKSPVLSSRAARFAATTLAAVALSVFLHTATLAADDAPPAVSTPAASAASVPSVGGSSSLPFGGFFDPSRASFHQSLQFGASTGGAYKGTAGLYTASFGYKLANPLHLNVDLGAAYTPQAQTAFGSTSYNPGFNGVFLQNLSLDWRPNASSLIRFSYQDYRSPLQWRNSYAPGYYDAAPAFGLPGDEPPSRN